VSIHNGGESWVHVRYRFECLISTTLRPGRSGDPRELRPRRQPRGGFARGVQRHFRADTNLGRRVRQGRAVQVNPSLIPD
jgi:hypothetical protein